MREGAVMGELTRDNRDREKRGAKKPQTLRVPGTPDVRDAVVNSLIRTENGSKFSNLELDSALSKYNFEKKDKALFAALYYGVNKTFNKGEGQPGLNFRHSFRDNAKQGILLSIIYLVFCGFITFDIVASFKGIGGVELPENYRMFAYVLILPVAFTIFYLFPYISRFSVDTKTALHNSFLLSASHFNHVLYLAILNVATLVACVAFPPCFLVLPALCTLLSSRKIEKDFSQAQEIADKAAAEAEGETDNETADGAAGALPEGEEAEEENEEE